MLVLANGEQFSTGRTRFFDGASGGEEGTAKIYIKIEPEGFGAPIPALVDTGAAWSILDREVAEAVTLLDGEGPPAMISTRHGPIRGRLENTTLTILADDGESLEVQATVFVSRDWPAGTFLGYSGLLERIRFAVDPQQNHFHFGPG
jgi:predicted aspartyl protease